MKTLVSIGFCLVLMCNIVLAQPRPDSGGPCSNENAAYDEMRLRTMATKTSLELLRDFRSALDDAYEATRKSSYAEAVVDTASLASGWPLGNAIQNRILGKVESKISENMIKAGFKSVNEALLKDQSLQGAIDNIQQSPATMGGMSVDVMKEGTKAKLVELFGETSGETIMGVFDVAKFGYERYKGMQQLDAIRAQLRAVDDQIVKMQTRETEQMDILRSSRSAAGICQDRVAQNLPPDPDNGLWRRVTDYLGPKWQGENQHTNQGTNQTVDKKEQIDERFLGSWTCACNITVQLGSNGKGVWIDNRGGPAGSMYESGSFRGDWTSSGNKASFYISVAEYKHRGGTIEFTLSDGKLQDQFGDVYVKD